MIQRLPIKQLQLNEGQIEGLPINPREWTSRDVALLAKSLEETPELYSARPMIAIANEDKYIVLGGNMRLSAFRVLGVAEVEVYVLPSDTPLRKLKEIVIKDNGAFGAWDYDELANEWDDLPLTEWGVPVWDVEDEEEDDEEHPTDKVVQHICKIAFVTQEALELFTLRYAELIKDNNGIII